MVTKEQLDKYIEAYQQGNPLITDEEYDALLEEYLDETGEENRPFLRSKQSDNVNDIVGTLPKVYNVLKPMRDGQKTYETWVKTKKIPLEYHTIVQPKFDGCSISLDMFTGRFYTRGDYDNGESVDVTELFTDVFNVSEANTKIDAIKFEAIMSHECFEKIKQLGYKRPRDAVAGIISSRNKELASLITLIPLRLYFDKRQYVASSLQEISFETYVDDYDGIESFINEKLADGAVVKYKDLHYSIDGVVASAISDEETIPDWEVAIKILNNVKETKLKYVDFQLGKTGKITPVGVLEPVMFDGVIVDHVGLSTFDRIIQLELHHNDTVRIVYNIVPYLIESLHDGDSLISIPTKCPVCGHELNMITMKTVRCTNPKCDGLRVGLINRYCEKMKMMGISKGIITKLYDNNLVKSIGDLYRLTPDMIMSIDGFKEKSANNIIRSIRKASKDVSLDRWMGALPIKDISSKLWRLLIDARYPMDDLKAACCYRDRIENGTPNEFMEECIPIYVHGFSSKLYATMKEGLFNHWDEIKDVIQYITFKSTTNMNRSVKGRVTLTGTRDEKLISYLQEKGYEVSDFSSKTIALVIPYMGFRSSKVDKALKNRIPVYTIEEAYVHLK